jgi:3-phosphoshikimate 1-carboxyvinyltransferase
MRVIIYPSGIGGTIQAPTSKSSMQRACAAALVRKGETIIKNPGHSNDDLAALRVIGVLGATIENLGDGSLRIMGNGVDPAGDTVDCGESGLGVRMFTPIIALCSKRMRIEGKGSLLNRPVDFFDKVLPQLGVEVISNNGKLPLVIKGPLQPKEIEIDGSLSSQFLTGLIVAYAASGAENLSISVKNLTSKPYIDLTLQIMKHFGWKIENRNYEEFYFPYQAQNISSGNGVQAVNYTVEGDWSGAAFLLVAAAIAGSILIKGLDIDSTQADKAILQALVSSGAKTIVRSDGIEIARADLKPFEFDASDCPDLFPPLVSLAAYCEGTSVIGGIHRLTHKESNRALTLQEEFGKIGVSIDLKDDQMIIKGGKGVKGGLVNSRHDHRIAMACSVAGLKAGSEVIIEEAEAVEKSYPGFYQDLLLAGASVEILYPAFTKL